MTKAMMNVTLHDDRTNYETNIIFTECSALNIVSFPTKLYRMLDDVERLGNTGIISWSNDGLFFIVHQPKVFAKTCMKKYFNQSKYKSFQRQLNVYEFQRVPHGKILGIYSHPLFRRGNAKKLNEIRRIKQKRSPTATMNNSSATKNSSRTKQTTTALDTGIVSSVLSDTTTTTTTTVATTKSIAGSSGSSSPIDSISFFKDNDDDDATSIGTIGDEFVAPPKLLYNAVNFITNNVMHMNNRGIFNAMMPPHHLFPIKKAIGFCANNNNYSSINSLGSHLYNDSFPLFKDDYDDTTSIGTIEDVSCFEEPCLLLPSSRISPKIIFG